MARLSPARVGLGRVGSQHLILTPCSGSVCTGTDCTLWFHSFSHLFGNVYISKVGFFSHLFSPLITITSFSHPPSPITYREKEKFNQISFFLIIIISKITTKKPSSRGVDGVFQSDVNPECALSLSLFFSPLSFSLPYPKALHGLGLPVLA